MNHYTVYTDGSSIVNPGPSAWCAILINEQTKKETVLSGGAVYATNNEMEMTAVLKALEHVKQPSVMTIHTDSAYIVNCIRDKWYQRWMRNRWRNADNEPVKNQSLWLAIIDRLVFHTVTFVKVKAHSNDRLNNKCDKIANDAARAMLGKINKISQ